MASVRLTNDMRERIVDILIARKYDEEKQQRVDESNRLFNALFDALLGPHKAAAESLPTSWLTRKIELNVRHNEVGDHHFPLKGKEARHVPNGVAPYWIDIDKLTIQLDDDDDNFDEDEKPPIFRPAPKNIKKKLADDIVKFGKREREIGKEIDKLRHEIKGALSKVTTIKALYNLWPELKPLLKWDEDDGPKGTAIMPNLAKLNAEFKLPPKETANV